MEVNIKIHQLEITIDLLIYERKILLDYLRFYTIVPKKGVGKIVMNDFLFFSREVFYCLVEIFFKFF